VAYSGANYTPNDSTTLSVAWNGVPIPPIFYDDTGPNVNGSGSFSGSVQVPDDVDSGTISITITDQHGRSATDSIQIQ
jgi:hypothetical protein